MTAEVETPAEETPSEGAPPEESPRVGGWRAVARKEIADHLLSGRFVVLMGVLGIATAAAVFAASGGIRDVAPNAQGVTALFLKLFTVTADPVPFPLIVFVGFLAPLLGIMFGFDAVSGERSQGTLPRLLSQPIHRDEVILGKFVAGLTVVAIMLTALVLFVSGIGIVRLVIAGAVACLAGLAVAALVDGDVSFRDVVLAALVMLLAAGMLVHGRLSANLAELRRSRETGMTRILQGLSRSMSPEAVVDAIVAELSQTAAADHVVLARVRRPDRVIEVTLVAARASTPASRSST